MEKYLLITGQIARRALSRVAEGIKHIDLEIKSLGCTVAALMTTGFIARELARGDKLGSDVIIIIPGLCQGPLEPIIEGTGCKVLRGPNDLVDLPAFFQIGLKGEQEHADNNRSWPVQILAEIVNAPRMTEKEIVDKALYYRECGADIIDLGGDVDQPFPRLGEVIKVLKSYGFTVSVDSHQKEDILAADKAGAELILSFTSKNLEIAKDLTSKVVVIPDDGESMESLYRNMEKLNQWNIPYLVDPILPPLTMGLAEGIGRYLRVGKEFPDCEMLMGLGNVTELADADSTGINALMMGIAGELQINYILTTEVSHRAKGAVQEVNLARRLIRKAIFEQRVPKHLDESLLTIKDPSGNSYDKAELYAMHQVIRDRNYRIFVHDQIYVFNAHSFYQGTSAREIFSRLDIHDPRHAFYLGVELGKAETALQLGKRYVQDNPLRWGYLGEANMRKKALV
ncbi:MAG: PTS mannitol transporter subunit IIABC [Peptococcaceae bacterium]|nr:PTS mannitol transporter subunit IIABC [Peptococcaceae bacterium]